MEQEVSNRRRYKETCVAVKKTKAGRVAKIWPTNKFPVIVFR
jgi:hypothetical protein